MNEVSSATTAPVTADDQDDAGSSTWQTLRRILRTWPLVPAILIAMLLTAAIFAEILTPYDPEKDDLISRNIPPMWQEGGSSEHLLGTDPLGRDILARIIYGARTSLLIATIVLTMGTAFGLVVGLVAGYIGGTIDEILMRVVDFTFAVPFILVALVAVIVYGQSFELVIILLTIFSWNGVARQARAETLSLKTRDYVSAARVAGASIWRILWKHLTPGLINTIIVVTTLHLGSLILTEASLSFLGVGIPPPHTGMGRHGRRRTQLHLHRVVDIILPRTGHHAHRPRIQLLGRLVPRSL